MSWWMRQHIPEAGITLIDATLKARDDIAVDRIEYRLGDRGPFQPYLSPVQLNAYKSYKIVYRAYDLVGNVPHTSAVNIVGEYVPRK